MKSERLDLLAERWGACEACAPMRDKQKVYWRGDPDAPLALIGEAPGAEENDKGMPFVGPAGRKLDEAIEMAGLAPSDLFITNVIACQTPSRSPTIDELRNCSARLQETLLIVRPKALLLLGNVAARFAGIRSAAGNRGKVHIASVRCYDGRVRAWPAFVTHNPAFVLRLGKPKSIQLAEDIQQAWELALARRDKKR